MTKFWIETSDFCVINYDNITTFFTMTEGDLYVLKAYENSKEETLEKVLCDVFFGDLEVTENHEGWNNSYSELYLRLGLETILAHAGHNKFLKQHVLEKTVNSKFKYHLKKLNLITYLEESEGYIIDEETGLCLLDPDWKLEKKIND